MDLGFPDCADRSTPANQVAVESLAVVSDDDILVRKRKAEETSAAKEDDLLKSEQDDASEDSDDDEASDDEEEEEYKDVWVYHPEEYENEEHIVEEIDTDTVSLSSVLARDDGTFDPGDSDVFSDDEDRENCIKYYEQYVKSKGFDVENFCNKIIGGLLPLDMENQDPECPAYRDLPRTVESVIKHVNETRGMNLEFEKVTKCNVLGCTIYYATFEAKDKAAGVTRIYQTKADRDHHTGKTVLFRFREKPQEPKPEQEPEPKPEQ